MEDGGKGIGGDGPGGNGDGGGASGGHGDGGGGSLVVEDGGKGIGGDGPDADWRCRRTALQTASAQQEPSLKVAND